MLSDYRVIPACQKEKFVLCQECAQDDGDVLGTPNGHLEHVKLDFRGSVGVGSMRDPCLAG